MLIIGLDGATWDLINPLRKQGLLPVIDRLLRTGVWSNLQSTIPPATFPAWTTFMTGMNPGKHGVLDFTERIPGTYRLRFVNATCREAETVWQRLSRAGLRVGVMGVPATYPPENVNGFMISGFDSPVARSIDRSFVRPAGLYNEIRDAVGEYRISDVAEQYMDADWHAETIACMLASIEQKARTARYLYRREAWDCFMVLFGETDTVAHHYWKFHDSLSPRHTKSSESVAAAISTVYKKIDEKIGELLDTARDDTAIMLVSDHGFCGMSDKVLSINKWLAQEGLLQLKTSSSFLANCMGVVKQAGLRHLPLCLQEKVFRTSLRRVAQRVESASRFSGIVWNKTAAFSEDMNYFPGIHINLKGRDPLGTVQKGNEYERVRSRILERLGAWKDPDTGAGLVRRAWRREEIYKGAFLDRAPDIILDLNRDGPYAYVCLPHRLFPGQEAFRRLDPAEQGGTRLLSMSGAHRQDGILLFSPSCTGRGSEINGAAAIEDICPSILGFFGLPSDRRMDGRSIAELTRQTDMLPAVNQRCHTPNRRVAYTAEEEKTIARRLKNIGYFE